MKTEIGKVVIEDAYAVEEDYDMTETEKKLEEIVTDFPETEYNHKIAQEKNWAVLFSLSHIRWNLVEWLPFEKKDPDTGDWIAGRCTDRNPGRKGRIGNLY